MSAGGRDGRRGAAEREFHSRVARGLDRGLEADELLRRWLAIGARAEPSADWQALRQGSLDAEEAHLELALLEGLQAEARSAKERALWLRLRLSDWCERPDGAECVLECVERPSRGAPSTEFSEPLAGRGELVVASALLGRLAAAAGRFESARARELALGPVLVGTLAALAQAAIERLDSSLLLGDANLREVLVGFDGGPALSLGQCGEDAWYRDAVEWLE